MSLLRAVDRIGLGSRGERVAESFLRAQGYRILARNYRCRHGEIDLIAMDGEVLAFVEIKGRRGNRFGSPFEAVTAEKQRRIARVAQHYLLACRMQRARARFDVVGIRWGRTDGHECALVKDAFRL
ncbi:MAG: YraN family protein [Candidatus Aureabacteria bacterium]|nr:YraN family protein [Candidatus Auribacterota bacterium]